MAGFFSKKQYAAIAPKAFAMKLLNERQELGGEHYAKRFTAWIHPIVMLYAIINRFDSLREITTYK